jgi:hypothetical protein
MCGVGQFLPVSVLSISRAQCHQSGMSYEEAAKYSLYWSALRN